MGTCPAIGPEFERQVADAVRSARSEGVLPGDYFVQGALVGLGVLVPDGSELSEAFEALRDLCNGDASRRDRVESALRAGTLAVQYLAELDAVIATSVRSDTG